MIHNEQAYEDLGLTIDATRQQVEKRYYNVIKRLHTKEQLGTLTMMDELQWKSVSQAYRHILDVETNKLTNEYRNKHYGKYKKYARVAEKLDHFIFYYKFHCVGFALLLLSILLVVICFRQIQHEHTVLANLPVPDLKVMIDVANLPLHEFPSELSLEQTLLPLLPEWSHIESKYNASANNHSIMLLTENPDLYILDRDVFINLLRLGYLLKLDEWDSYGIDLSNGTLPDLLHMNGNPLIAAVSVNAERPENAIRFIRRFYNDTLIEQEVKKWDASLRQIIHFHSFSFRILSVN